MAFTLQMWFRHAAKQTALTLFLIVSLAIALGGGAFALSLNSAVLWRSLPFDDANELVAIEPTNENGQRRWLSWAELAAIAETPVEPFASIAGFTAADFNALADLGLPPEPLAATVVSPAFFRTFRIGAAHGRLPEPESYGASRDRVVLLSHGFWKRRYRGDRGIVGQSIRLSRPEYLGGGDEPYRVIGVLDRDTWLFWKDFDVVLPMQAAASVLSDPSSGLFERVVGRTGNTAHFASARASAPIVFERIRSAGSVRPTASLSVVDLQGAMFADLRPQLMVVLWLAVMVFLLAGLNVVISTIAQAAGDSRQMAVRIAIGASHWRLFGESLRAHAITLGIAGVLGFALAQWLVSAVGSQMPDAWLARIPGQLSALRVDRYTAAGVIGALAVMIFFSSGAVHIVTRRLAPASLLTSTATDNDRRPRWRSILVAVEIALCSAVVITSATLVTQLTTLRSVDMGVDAARTSAVWVNLGSSALSDPSSRVDYYDRILGDAAALSAVESIGGVSHPFTFGWGTVQVRDASQRSASEFTALGRAASPGYLVASGIRLVDGRWFSETDRANAPAVAAISASFAHTRWPGGSAIGKEIEISEAGSARSRATIVGIVGDTRNAPHLPPDRIVYRPIAQDPPPWLYLIVRARSGVGNAAQAVSEAIWRVNPDQPVDGPWTVAEWIRGRTSHLRFLALTSIVLGVVGLMLSAAGVYGLTAWSVMSSRRSIAVRRAVGASHRQICSWFIAKWAHIVVPGLVGGWVLQWGWTSILIAAITGLERPRPASTLLGLGLMALVSAGAAAIPLRSALISDNWPALRGD